jgi:hypothetical protein
MGLPKNLVYDIQTACADSHIACRVNDNTLLHCNPKADPRFPKAVLVKLRKGTFPTRFTIRNQFFLAF